MIRRLQASHGDLIFVHSEGCCDGTSPICMKKEDFYLRSQDEQVGEVVKGVPILHASGESPLLAAFAYCERRNGWNQQFLFVGEHGK